MIKQPNEGLFSGTPLEAKVPYYKNVKLNITSLKPKKISDSNFVIVNEFPYKRQNLNVIIRLEIVVDKITLDKKGTLELGNKAIDITEMPTLRKNGTMGYAFEIDPKLGYIDKILFE